MSDSNICNLPFTLPLAHLHPYIYPPIPLLPSSMYPSVHPSSLFPIHPPIYLFVHLRSQPANQPPCHSPVPQPPVLILPPTPPFTLPCTHAFACTTFFLHDYLITHPSIHHPSTHPSIYPPIQSHIHLPSHPSTHPLSCSYPLNYRLIHLCNKCLLHAIVEKTFSNFRTP